jgi:hypothetical protein
VELTKLQVTAPGHLQAITTYICNKTVDKMYAKKPGNLSYIDDSRMEKSTIAIIR